MTGACKRRFEESYFDNYTCRGLAVLASTSGGIPEMIRHRQTGLLHIPGDVASFTGELNYLIKNANLRAMLGNAAKEQLTEYAWPVIADRYLQAYNEAQEQWHSVTASQHRSANPDEEGAHV